MLGRITLHNLFSLLFVLNSLRSWIHFICLQIHLCLIAHKRNFSSICLLNLKWCSHSGTHWQAMLWLYTVQRQSVLNLLNNNTRTRKYTLRLKKLSNHIQTSFSGPFFLNFHVFQSPKIGLIWSPSQRGRSSNRIQFLRQCFT